MSRCGDGGNSGCPVNGSAIANAVYVRPPVARHHAVTGTRQGWGKLRNLKHKEVLKLAALNGTSQQPMRRVNGCVTALHDDFQSLLACLSSHPMPSCLSCLSSMAPLQAGTASNQQSQLRLAFSSSPAAPQRMTELELKTPHRCWALDSTPTRQFLSRTKARSAENAR